MTENSSYIFFVADYQQDTAHLSLIEHGAYRMLLDHYYKTGEPLPSDPKLLCRICRVTTRKEREIVLKMCSLYFTLTGQGNDAKYCHKKCDEQIAKRLKYSKSQSAKAKLRHMPDTIPDDSRSTSPPPAPTRALLQCFSTLDTTSSLLAHEPRELPPDLPADWLRESIEIKKWNEPTARAVWQKFSEAFAGKNKTVIGWKVAWCKWWSGEHMPEIQANGGDHMPKADETYEDYCKRRGIPQKTEGEAYA